jgi:hypothetical protein
MLGGDVPAGSSIIRLRVGRCPPDDGHRPILCSMIRAGRDIADAFGEPGRDGPQLAMALGIRLALRSVVEPRDQLGEPDSRPESRTRP